MGVVITVDVVVGVLVHGGAGEEDGRVEKERTEIPHLQHDSPHIGAEQAR